MDNMCVTDLWLVQLPSFWQDVSAQHTRHSTHRQFDRHCLWQRLDLVESDLLQCRLSDTERDAQLAKRIVEQSYKLSGITDHIV